MNIKFRVWDKNLKKFDDTNNYFIGPDGEVRYLTWNSETNKGPWGWYIGSSRNKKNDDVVVQFWTGLVDKNGIDIYNGDIIKLNRTDSFSKFNIGEIFYWDECAKFSLKSIRKIQKQDQQFYEELGIGVFDDLSIIIDLDYWKNREVIGNVFENPELLEEKQ